MKNSKIAVTAGVVLLAVILGGCFQDVPYDGNTEEKTLRIFGASAVNGEDTDTPLIKSCHLYDNLAGIETPKAASTLPTGKGTDTISFALVQFGTLYRWRGNGPHYVKVTVENDGKNLEYWYTESTTSNSLKKVDFNKKFTPLPWALFKVVE